MTGLYVVKSLIADAVTSLLVHIWSCIVAASVREGERPLVKMDDWSCLICWRKKQSYRYFVDVCYLLITVLNDGKMQ